MTTQPAFSMGIEEEYLLVDPTTCALAPAPQEMMDACAERLEGQFSPEFKACQVEIGTRVAADIKEARDDLKHLRATVWEVAKDFGLAPIAASCHPFADWKEQHHKPSSCPVSTQHSQTSNRQMDRPAGCCFG